MDKIAPGADRKDERIDERWVRAGRAGARAEETQYTKKKNVAWVS